MPLVPASEHVGGSWLLALDYQQLVVDAVLGVAIALVLFGLYYVLVLQRAGGRVL